MAGLENRLESQKNSAPQHTVDVIDLWKDAKIQQRSEGSGNQQRLTIGNEEYRQGQSSSADKTVGSKGAIKFELPKIGFELPKIPGT
jgi:hypothetical protein